MNNTQVLGHMAVALLQLSCCQLAGLTAGQAGGLRPAGWADSLCGGGLCGGGSLSVEVALLQLSCCQLAGQAGSLRPAGWAAASLRLGGGPAL